ncbi:MAG: fibronectin type III domain-containing protein, partial [Candidatus Omnitrophica bacterium]|nr:fibronectin type III domain-containing protein [Candidatus Omnitrophota bacterium]
MERYKKIVLCGWVYLLVLTRAIFAFPEFPSLRGEFPPYLPYGQNNSVRRNFPEDFSFPFPPDAGSSERREQSLPNYADAWQEVERILNTHYEDKDKQIEDLISALKKWAELYNQEKDPQGKLVRIWFPEANSLAQVDFTAMVRNLMQNPFYGNHPLWRERVNLLIEAGIGAGLWYGEIPQGFADALPPATPTKPPEITQPRSDEIKIEWEKIADAETYILELLDEKGEKIIHTIAGIKENSFTIKLSDLSKYGLEEGKIYRARIRGVNKKGRSGEASPMSEPFKIEKVIQSPGKPPAPRTDKESYKLDESITITWSPVEGVITYNLYILDGQGKVVKKISNLTETSYTATGKELGLEEGKEYRVSVSGLNSAGEGERSEPSEVFKIEKSLQPPARPVKPRTDKSSYKPDEKIEISWDVVEEAESYNLYIYDQSGKEVKKITGIKETKLVTAAQELGLEQGNYYLKVSAVNKAGESELSEASENFSIVPSAVPQSPVSAQPTGLSVSLSGDRTQATITWQWSGDPGAEFEIQIAPEGENIEEGEIISVGKGTTAYTFENLAPGTYQVRLRAKEPGKQPSPWTEVVRFKISSPQPPTPVTPPETPQGLKVQASPTEVVITWEKVEEANGGYEIEIRDVQDNLVHTYQ